MLDPILDFFFPKTCEGCLNVGQYLCAQCREIQISHIVGGGKMMSDEGSMINQRNLDEVVAVCKYTKFLEKYLADIKYEFYYRMLDDVNEIIIDFVQRHNWVQDIINSSDMITSIPLSKYRLRWRGFNQSAIIAQSLSKAFNKSYIDLLIRKKFTSPQVGLSKKERKKNVEGVFEWNSKVMLDKKFDQVLLVDDVFTTGSTMASAGKVLKENGVKRVIGFAFAKA